jgi:FtsZ-interacting cell division protein ZipA
VAASLAGAVLWREARSGMSDSPWVLRMVLLLLGVAIIAAVYVFGTLRRRQRNRSYGGFSPIRARRNLEPDFDSEPGPDPTGDEIIAVRVRKVEPLGELPALRNEAAIDPPLTPAPPAPLEDETPRAPTGRGRRARGKSRQLDFGFGSLGDAEPVTPPPAEPALLTLYLRPQRGDSFAGPVIVRNVNAVGMRHGELGIFHHFGAGELRTERPLFGLANMFEPGDFDLQRIEAFQTQGLVMFLNLPAALDGAVAFELFLNTAQRLAEGLQAELLGAPRQPLAAGAIEQMRRTASGYPPHGD